MALPACISLPVPVRRTRLEAAELLFIFGIAALLVGVLLAEIYGEPSLCNYYCSKQCPIGKKYVPEIKSKDLAQIVLELLSSLNSMKKRQERLIEITADSVIADDEIRDFVSIQKELEKISVTVEGLQLWVEKMLSDKKINPEKYNNMING